MRIAPGEIVFAVAGLAVLPELLGAKAEEPLAVANDDPAPPQPDDDGFSTASGPDDESDTISKVSEPTQQTLNATTAQSQAPPRLSEEANGLLETAFSDESLTTALLTATATQPVESTAPPAVVEIPLVKIPPIRNPSGGGGGGGSGPQGTGGGGGGGQGESSQSLFAGQGEGVITLRGGGSGSQTLSEGESYVAAEDDTGYEVSHGIGPLNGWSVAINDFVAGPEPATVQLVSGPSNAQSFTFYADGSFDYMPTYGQIGIDSFVYQLSSGDASDTATAYIYVYNIPPSGEADEYGAVAGTTLEVTAAEEGLLSNDSDFDGIGNSHLSVADYTQPVDEFDQSVGSVTVNSNGTFSFTAPDDYIGTLTFDYWVADEFAQAPEPTTVTIGVNDLHVFNGITNITTMGQAVVGQRISLSVQIVGPGFFGKPFEIRDVQWTIPGDNVKDYLVSLTQGKVIPLEPEDLASQWVSFYWTDGIPLATVTAIATVRIGAGLTQRDYAADAAGHVAVLRPEADLTATLTSNPKPVDVGDEGGGTVSLHFGTLHTLATVGITWQGTVTTSAGGAGEIAFFQTTKMDRTLVFPENVQVEAGTYVRSSAGSYVLDHNHELQQVEYDPATQIGEQVAATITGRDTPGIRLDIQTSASSNDAFITFLMYKPAGTTSIWVPLRQLSWWWKGQAIQDPASTSGYSLVDNSGDSPDDAPVSSNTNTPPEWTKNRDQVTYVKQ